MAIVEYQAWLAVPKVLNRDGASKMLVKVVGEANVPVQGSPLEPLPYAKKLWAQADPMLVFGGPVLSTERAIAKEGDAAWPISAFYIDRGGDRSALTISVGTTLPDGHGSSWQWFCEWTEALVSTGSFDFALINGSSDEPDDANGEGVPALKSLDRNVPAVAAAWFFIGSGRLAALDIENRKRFEAMAYKSVEAGLIFIPSPNFMDPIPKLFLREVAAVAGETPRIFHGRL